MTVVSDLPNLGPKSRQMLERAGLVSLDQLRAMGAIAAFVQVKRTDCRPSLNLLWALEGALSGLGWQLVAREHRTSLLLALETYEHEAQGMNDRLAEVQAEPLILFAPSGAT